MPVDYYNEASMFVMCFSLLWASSVIRFGSRAASVPRPPHVGMSSKIVEDLEYRSLAAEFFFFNGF